MLFRSGHSAQIGEAGHTHTHTHTHTHNLASGGVGQANSASQGTTGQAWWRLLLGLGAPLGEQPQLSEQSRSVGQRGPQEPLRSEGPTEGGLTDVGAGSMQI